MLPLGIGIEHGAAANSCLGISVWCPPGMVESATALRSPTPARSSDAAMPRDELIVQLIKIALALAIGAYFIWWSLEVLHRLPVR
jgi:hypothetical protein